MRVAHWAVLAGVVAVSAAVPASRAEDAPRSGPAVGSSASAFDVHDITGKNKGKKLCYV